jgi:uncharacterized membrane protein YdbT with pleckstrin-like domain
MISIVPIITALNLLFKKIIMNENTYQKLGTRSYIYDIVTRSMIPILILILTLALIAVNNFFSSSVPTGFTDILPTLVSWGLLATLITFIVVIFIAWMDYMTFQFSLGTDIFKIKRGILTKQEMAIPYRRIESVDIQRTLIHQLFGVSRITIETTIDSQSSADDKPDASDEVFPIIDHTLAQTIQEELTKRANVQRMKV